MQKPSTSDRDAHLNPFAFPSETDIRFLLLVLAIAGSTMILVQALIGIFIESTLIAFPSALVVTVSLFVIAWHQARQSAVKTIEINKWQPFPPQKADPLQSASFQQMDHYIQLTVANVSELASEKIQFIWDETSRSSTLPTGMAFGFGKQQYVCLRQGLHEAFIQFPESPTFQSVLMHELGHIANRDVSKTVFAISLGQCFFPIAIFSVVVFTVYTLWAVGDRLVKGITLDSAQPGIQEIVNTNIKIIILLLIVEIARASILRVREYYADARARNWLGTSTTLTQLFSEYLGRSPQKNSNLKNKNQRGGLYIWEFLEQQFRSKLAPFHPTHHQRISRLENPRHLFSLSYEVALLAGFLSGVSLNANMTIFSIFPEISNFNSQLNQSVQAANEPTLLVILTTLLFFALTLVFFAIFLAVFVVFGLIPIVGTVGLQIQQAAFADCAQPTQPRLLTLQRLMAVSLVLGTGFILGCLLSPFIHALSMRTSAASIPWLGILGLAIGWAGVFFIWIVSIARLAGSLYLNHAESSIPRQKRRWLTRLSGILLFPIFLWMCMVQILFGAKAVNPDLAPVSTLVIGCMISGVFAFILYGIIWVAGWSIGSARGWFRNPQCPYCNSVINNQSGLLQNCHECDRSITSWAWLPLPILFPSPPSLSVPVLDTAPPL